MKRASNTCWIVIATASFLAAADAPYLGKWKLNPAKSQLTGEMVSVEQTPSGGMRLVSAEVSYDFKTDGKEYPTPSGATISYKEVSPNVSEVTIRMKGQVVANIGLVVKGDTLEQKTRRPKSDGGTDRREFDGNARVWRTGDIRQVEDHQSTSCVEHGVGSQRGRWPDP